MAVRPGAYLSLCAGYGGLDDAVARAFCGAVPLCYVEIGAEVACILARRMEEGTLPPAPVWSDLACGKI